MHRVFLAFLLVSTCFSQTNKTSNPCLIVKQNKGHRVRNGFLFGVAGLAFSKGERFEYVDAINFPNSQLKYKGDELQKLKDTGVHVIVVSEGAGDEIQSARASCQANFSSPDAKPTMSAMGSGVQIAGTPQPNEGALLGVSVRTSEQGGTEIVEIAPGGPASVAGFHVGNVINSVDGKLVRSTSDLAIALANRAPGSTVRLGYMFRNPSFGLMQGADKMVTLNKQ